MQQRQHFTSWVFLELVDLLCGSWRWKIIHRIGHQFQTRWLGGGCGLKVFSVTQLCSESYLLYVLSNSTSLFLYLVCVPGVIRSSSRLHCTTEKCDAEVIIWETFKVTGYRVFLLHVLREWSSRIKRYITGIFLKAQLRTPTVMQVSNWLERKAT